MEKIKTRSLSHQYLPIWVQEGREMVFYFNLDVWGFKVYFQMCLKARCEIFSLPHFQGFPIQQWCFSISPKIHVWDWRSLQKSLHCIFSPLLAFSFQGKSGSALPPPRDYIMGNICRSIPSAERPAGVRRDTSRGLGVFLMFWRFPWAFASHHQPSGEMIIEWSVLLSTGLRSHVLQGTTGWFRLERSSGVISSSLLSSCWLCSSQVPNSSLSFSFSPLTAPQSIWHCKMKRGREGLPKGPLSTAPNNLADFWSHQLPVWGDQAAEAFLDGEDVAWARQELCWG